MVMLCQLIIHTLANRIQLIYLKEVVIKETTEIVSSASFLNIYLKFDTKGQLSTSLYDKRDDF